MSRRNLYFLVARDRDTNQFSIIDTTDGYGSSLEEIDLFTSRYYSEEDLTKKLKREGKTKSRSLDIFVAYQKKEKGERKLCFRDALYSSGERIREIANASLEGKLEDKSQKVSYIFYEFCEKLKHDQSFYDRVLFGQTDLYQKFTEYFSDRRYLDSFYVKYKDGGWVLKSYPLIREMVSVMRSFENNPNGKDYSRDEEARRLLEKDLLDVTDKDYDPNQISLLTLMGEDSLESELIAHGLLPQKEVKRINGYTKRKPGEGTH